MRRVTAEELKEVLRKHELWLNNDPQGEKANLSCAYLYRANLSGADLSGANLSYTILYEANLSEASLGVADLSGACLCRAYLGGAYLRGANLREANLREANLYGANLRVADLSGANLRVADLSGANLCGADLSGANLRVADLSGANLCEADLSRADLYRTDLRGVNLHGADLNRANLTKAEIDFPMVCPEKGSFTGYKKCKNGLIVELEIPEDALRSSATTRKCRCSKAKVISITNLDGFKSEEKKAISNRDSSFVYKLGETIEVPNFDPNRWNECSTGIHFFMAREEAVNYIY